MIRTGLVGGTFDPIHRGHTALIKAALDSDRLDRVIVMPAGRPPHKEQQRVLPASYRLAMTEKAFSGLDGITVSNLEISQKRRSYTIDTIRRLRPYLPDSSELVLVYGSDILLDLEHWYHPEEVLNECKLLLARRGGYDAVEAERLAAMFRQRYGARIEFFDCPQIDLSSSEIRQAISSGRPWKANVPKAVAAL
ncbi:MAG: nicotinate (nicotinamide) nucleotide adenylyltransferase, partial [Eubacteriales bacterium]|nr:nicotinate (nicotinamide) nucleotide adenylyltransferase [Eubacteriales bacterium]